MNETYLGGLHMSMNFGRVFRYQAKLSSGEYVVWRVCAETRVSADVKVADYIAECKKNGFYNIPVTVDYEAVREEDDLVLF
jgi:hypothetical protein